MSYIAPGTSPAKIWSYATRTLANHKRFLFIGNPSPVDVIGGFAKTEATESVTVSTIPVVIASYTENCVAGKVRVRVYVNTGGSSYTIALLIDGNEVASVTTSSTALDLKIDYVGDITAGSHTFEIKITSGSTYGITVSAYAVIINGVAIDSTTSSTVFSTTNVPSYTLEVNGNFKYEVGIRYKMVYNRKTTTTASITLNGEAPQNADLSANDDGDSTVTGYGTCPYNTTLSIDGAVGTTGDVVIITNLYVMVCLRGNQTYTGNGYTATVEMIAEEEGWSITVAKIYSLSGDSISFSIYELQPYWLLTTYVSGATTTTAVINGIARPLANNSSLGFHTTYGVDSVSKGVIHYLLVVII